MSRSRVPYSELLIGAATGAAFVALARKVTRARPTAVDRAAHNIARRRYNRVLECVMLPIEVVGLPAVYIPVAVLTARHLRRHGRRGGPVIVTAAAAGWIAMRGARLRFARKRPPRPLHRGPKAELSFPSGHTTGMTALAVAAGIVLARERAVSEHIARGITIGVPILVAFNRAYVREHWLTDTVGGWLLGTSVACTCLAVDRFTGRAR